MVLAITLCSQYCTITYFRGYSTRKHTVCCQISRGGHCPPSAIANRDICPRRPMACVILQSTPFTNEKRAPFGAHVGGGCGIRTHVRLLSNGFQDRLVMTASITLRIVLPRVGGPFSVAQQVAVVKRQRLFHRPCKKNFLFFSFWYCTF